MVFTCKQSDSGYRDRNWPCCSYETALCQRWRRRRRWPVGEEGSTEISLRGWKDAVVRMWGGKENRECSADMENMNILGGRRTIPAYCLRILHKINPWFKMIQLTVKHMHLRIKIFISKIKPCRNVSFCFYCRFTTVIWRHQLHSMQAESDTKTNPRLIGGSGRKGRSFGLGKAGVVPLIVVQSSLEKHWDGKTSNTHPDAKRATEQSFIPVKS